MAILYHIYYYNASDFWLHYKKFFVQLIVAQAVQLLLSL